MYFPLQQGNTREKPRNTSIFPPPEAFNYYWNVMIPQQQLTGINLSHLLDGRTEWRMCLGTATTNNWNRAAVTQTKHLSFRTPIIRTPCPVMSRFLFGFYTTAFGRWLCGVDETQCFDNPISNGIWPKSICTNFPHRGEERIIPVGWTTSTTRYEAVSIKGVSPEWCLFSENRIY